MTDAGLIGIGKSDHSTASHLRSAGTDRDAGFRTLIKKAGRGRDWSSDTIFPRRRTGASQSGMRDVFEHVAIYAGSPRADLALKIAGKILADMKDTPPSERQEETGR